MLRNYKELKVRQKSYELESMLKAMIKSLENKPMNPWTLFSK